MRILPYAIVNRCLRCSLPWKCLDRHFTRHWWSKRRAGKKQ